jgi:hypothetical protein
MTTPVEKALEVLIGREPKSEEVEKFYRIKEELGLGNHDAIWSVLLALGHYETLYGEIPDRIRNASADALAHHQAALTSSSAALEVEVKSKLVDAVSAATAGMTQEVIASAKTAVSKLRAGDNNRTFIAAATISAGLISAVLCAVAWGSYELGARSTGDAYIWHQSRKGQAAERFGNLNNVEVMLNCPKPFDRRTTNDGVYCIPYDAASGAGKMYGWRIK